MHGMAACRQSSLWVHKQDLHSDMMCLCTCTAERGSGQTRHGASLSLDRHAGEAHQCAELLGQLQGCQAPSTLLSHVADKALVAVDHEAPQRICSLREGS